jgi:hypothetical protein
MRTSFSWTPLIISLVLTPPCLFIAAISGGVGHGDYTPLIVLFPLAALSAELDHYFNATILRIVIAVMQFPLYGLSLGIAVKRGTVVWVVVGLSVLHILATLIALRL